MPALLSTMRMVRSVVIGIAMLSVLHDVTAYAATKGDRLTRAKKLLEEKKVYDGGCSPFISEVLQITPITADEIIGDDKVAVTKDKGKFTNLDPGDVVGWKTTPGHVAHVAIYVGDYDKGVVFIDVPGPKTKDRPMPVPRTLKSYGDDDSRLIKTTR